MAADAGKLYVDPALMTSGAASSRQAAGHAGDGATKLAGASVGNDLFGGFPAANAFAGQVSAAQADHVQLLQGHRESLGNLAGNADTVAASFTETEDHNASALRAIRCNSAT
jgi:Protein of unknown function (DUF2563)